MEKVDLSVEVAGVKFKNPVIVGASDMTYDLRGIRRCAESGAGGLIIKTLSTQPLPRTRTCPYLMSLERFGKGLDTGSFVGSEAYSTKIPETWLKEVGLEAVKVCHDAGVTFIASMAIQLGDDKQDLVDLAKRIEEIGPDMIQVPCYICPNQVALPKVDALLDLESELLGAIKDAVSTPISAKTSVIVYPHLFTDRCLGYEKAGVSHISLNISPEGIAVDVENEDFFALPLISGMQLGRAGVPLMAGKVVEAKQAGVKSSICVSGGIWQWTDAVGYMLVGADTVEICSLAYFKGPRVLGRIVNQIEDWMIRKGYHSVSEFVGKLLPKVRAYEDVVPEVYPVPSPITPTIDYELCNLCGLCLDSCVYGGIERMDRERGEVVLNKELCWGCGLCVSRCPKDAMKLVDKSGVVYWDGHGLSKLWLP